MRMTSRTFGEKVKSLMMTLKSIACNIHSLSGEVTVHSQTEVALTVHSNDSYLDVESSCAQVNGQSADARLTTSILTQPILNQNIKKERDATIPILVHFRKIPKQLCETSFDSNYPESMS